MNCNNTKYSNVVLAHMIRLCYKNSTIAFECYNFSPDMMNMVALAWVGKFVCRSCVCRHKLNLIYLVALSTEWHEILY